MTSFYHNHKHLTRDRERWRQIYLICTDEAQEDFAQHLRRDCEEISGIQATERPICEDIVASIDKEMGLELDGLDISTAHLLQLIATT